MPVPQNPTTVDQAFFQPLTALADASPHTRPCPELSDEDSFHLGVQRVLETSASGRVFLQEHGLRFPNTPGQSNYFAALNSPRRRAVIRDVNLALVAADNATLHDRLADIPELATYERFAQDGHWHKAGAHEPRHDGAKMAVGHFYSLNLRTHTLRHLAAAEGLHEHDMSALKRVQPKGLRQGKRVLLIYDKAGIDFAYWKRCRCLPCRLPIERHPRSAGVSLGGASGLGGGTPPQLAGETPALCSWPRRWHRTGVPFFVRAISPCRR